MSADDSTWCVACAAKGQTCLRCLCGPVEAYPRSRFPPPGASSTPDEDAWAEDANPPITAGATGGA